MNMYRWRLQLEHQHFLPRLCDLPQGHGHLRGDGDQRRRLRPQGQGPAVQQHLDQHCLQIREVHRLAVHPLPQQGRT